MPAVKKPIAIPRKKRPGAGRPAVLRAGRDVKVYLDAESLETARRLGGGNISAGIRAALRSQGDNCYD